MKVIIIANACQWASWPAKIAAIKAFYAPLVELDIDIRYTDFTAIPTGKYPGSVTQFLPTGAVDVPGTDTELDQTWFADNIGPMIEGYDIAVFQTTTPNGDGLPLGIKFEKLNGTWCCETFVLEETDNYYLPGMIELGNSAQTIIAHEISHALYSISGQNDNTHLYFYANKFSKVLTDIKLPVDSTILGELETELVEAEKELGIIKENQSTADMNANQIFPSKIIAWAKVIGQEEGATPESNNPGNLKYTTLTASWGATKGRPATDGGFLCQFQTSEAGMTALCNFLKLGCEDELIAFHSPAARTLGGFTVIYAGNPPQDYILAIEKGVGETGGVQISSFLN